MGFIDRLSNAWEIFKTSFEFIGRDKSLLIMPIVMFFGGIVYCASILLLFPLQNIINEKYWIAILFAVILVAEIVGVFLASIHSWMVHEVAQGKDATVFSGFKRAMHNFLDILAYAIVFLIISIFLGALRRRGPVGAIAAGFFGLMAGIVGKLVLPAMIVTERNFGEAIKQLKHSTKAIPEIAAFEVGIRPLAGLVSVLSFLIALFLGSAINIFVGVGFFFVCIILIILVTLFINNTYYTLLYLSLIEKKHIKGLKLR